MIRPPNLFTVPGDPLAGFALAAALNGRLPPLAPLGAAMAASLLLYVSGLIGNDVADADEDAVERPARPLPSGRVSRRRARIAASLAGLAGAAAAALAGPQALFVSVLLIVMIGAYNGGLKRIPVVGTLAMGACRALSVLLGAAAAHWGSLPLVGLGAAMIGLYIAAVTEVARRETSIVALGWRRWMPAWALLAGFTGLGLQPVRHSEIFTLMAGAATLNALWLGWTLAGTPSPSLVAPTVGKLIRNLLLIQAACALLNGNMGLAVAIPALVAWPLAALSARRFYAS